MASRSASVTEKKINAFGSIVNQLVRYILNQLFTSVSVKVVDIYLHFGE